MKLLVLLIFFSFTYRTLGKSVLLMLMYSRHERNHTLLRPMESNEIFTING